MSALSQASGKGIDLKAIEAIVNPIIWDWVSKNQDMVIFQYKGKFLVFPVSVSIRVRDCDALITMLVGPKMVSLPPSGTF